MSLTLWLFLQGPRPSPRRLLSVVPQVTTAFAGEAVVSCSSSGNGHLFHGGFQEKDSCLFFTFIFTLVPPLIDVVLPLQLRVFFLIPSNSPQASSSSSSLIFLLFLYFVFPGVAWYSDCSVSLQSEKLPQAAVTHLRSPLPTSSRRQKMQPSIYGDRHPPPRYFRVSSAASPHLTDRRGAPGRTNVILLTEKA